ncbi:SAM-dependent methyltransferase [Streptomyces sp. WAC 06738]|uniref:class I SAM-dependent methyltransferase n=1 Tax=Streptomyces sp. WAC 06738 TaxID=2203210 RepID=UPI000F6F92BE|nr:class I SAM-dependent methyltransferase [Streptomyces sp. WAC 06738]AZM46448.1 SAM-dependent methyltransferase [Streptomyces sp. WAC 06738]
MNTAHWDAMYGGSDQVFSGNPNAVLVAEAAGLPPGRALDAGCGEGADARWLARRGWRVTAVDVSGVALRRAAAAATGTGGRVTWTRADLMAAPPPAGAYDLVSVHYFPLRRRPGHAALRGLLDAVAPGGTLLFATHAPADPDRHGDPGFDPAGYYQPGEIAELLAPAWDILLDETRPRTTPPPAGTHHTHDTVLKARRPR